MSDMNDPVYKEIVTARIKLLLEKPFFGNLATRLIAVDASSWCKTAATDGRHLFYNREFIKSLNRSQLLFLLGHEVLHCVLDHLGRRGGRDKDLWNMACDFLINFILVKEKLGSMTGPLATGCYDEKYTDEMTSEEIYELLKKNRVTIKMPLDEHLELGADKGDENEGGGNGQQDSKGRSGGGQKEVEVTITGKDGPPKLTEEDLAKIRNEVRAALIQTVQQVGAGNVPAGIRRMIDSLLEPKLDWRSLLDAHIRSAMKDDYTFQRLSRRAWHTGMVLPAQDFMDRIEVFVAIDASGSMTEEMLRDLLSEVKGICTTFRDFVVDVVTFDTEVYDHQRFTPENIDDIDKYPCNGGGGTAFEAVWEYLKRNGIEPHRLVVFTDGLPGGTWGDPDYCDTLFIIHTTKNMPPFGIGVEYEPRAE